MNVIVAVDENWAIGRDNELLARIPGDMRMFRRHTTGHVVVMGRRTLESFPNKMPLPERTNIVLSHSAAYWVKDAVVVNSLEELLGRLRVYETEKVYVIGGESVYRQMLPYCDTAYVTKIAHVYPADRHFPNLDRMPQWRLAEESEEQTYLDLKYWFLKYEKVQEG